MPILCSVVVSNKIKSHLLKYLNYLLWKQTCQSWQLNFKLKVSPENYFYISNRFLDILLWTVNCGSLLINIFMKKGILNVCNGFFKAVSVDIKEKYYPYCTPIPCQLKSIDTLKTSTHAISLLNFNTPLHHNGAQ